MTLTEDYILDKLQAAIDDPDKWTFDGLNGHIQNYKDFRGPYFEKISNQSLCTLVLKTNA